jgi:hypothetical protein
LIDRDGHHRQLNGSFADDSSCTNDSQSLFSPPLRHRYTLVRDIWKRVMADSDPSLLPYQAYWMAIKICPNALSHEYRENQEQV